MDLETLNYGPIASKIFPDIGLVQNFRRWVIFLVKSSKSDPRIWHWVQVWGIERWSRLHMGLNWGPLTLYFSQVHLSEPETFIPLLILRAIHPLSSTYFMISHWFVDSNSIMEIWDESRKRILFISMNSEKIQGSQSWSSQV